MKILIIRLSSIGDVVHTLPVLAKIRRSLPETHVSWAVEQSAAEILRGNPLIDELIEIDTRSNRRLNSIDDVLIDLGRQVTELRQRTYDVAIDFQGLMKSALVAKFTRSRRRFGFDRSGLREPPSRFLLTDTVETPKRIHVIRKNLALADAALGMVSDESAPEFPIFTDDSHRAEADTVSEIARGEFALLNPAGGWPTKLWSAERFGRLADLIYERYGIPSVVSTGPSENGLAMRVLGSSRSGRIITSEPTLKGFYEIARRARVYVGGDTGPTHLATAADCPVVGIFGPTEWWYNGSPRPDDICVERNDIGCRIDCNRRSCSNWICLEIPVETVFEAVAKRLEPLR